MRSFAVSSLALTALLLAGCDGTDLVDRLETRERPDRPARVEPLAPAPLDAPEVGGAHLGVIPEVAERVVPSVVNISATRTERVSRRGRSPLFSDPFFRRFFEEPGRGQPDERRERSLGSGVIVDDSGVILTNHHVVAGAEEALVSLTDGRELVAEVVGTDPKSEVAVLRLKGEVEGLSALPFGSSSSLRLGQTVLAIGNPFGVGQTLTMGIVSATGRSGMGIVDYEDFIQTDAAINPGNSGGALVNLKGELVGINTAILSRSGGYQGIGFAIPSDMVRVIMQDLLDDGVVDRGYLGVQIQDISRHLAEAMQLATTRGALVAHVMPESPAAEAGIREGDVIVSLDGRSIDSAQELKNAVALKGSDARVSVSLLRDGEERRVEVRLGALDAERDRDEAAAARETGTSLEGLALRELDERARRRLDLSIDEGLLVTRVDPESAAARAGLAPGDVVIEVDRAPVASTKELSEQLEASERSTVLLTVVRNGGRLFVALPRS